MPEGGIGTAVAIQPLCLRGGGELAAGGATDYGQDARWTSIWVRAIDSGGRITLSMQFSFAGGELGG